MEIHFQTIDHVLAVEKVAKIANLISKLNFYKLIPYPMDNMLYRSAQTGPPNVRKRHPVFHNKIVPQKGTGHDRTG